MSLSHRRHSTSKELDKFNDPGDISASANVAYGHFESSINQNVVYEELDKMASSVPQVGGADHVTIATTREKPQQSSQVDEGHYYL